MATPVDEVPSAYAASAPTSSVATQGAPAQSSAHVAFASESSVAGVSAPAGDESDLHKKAKRFAKLLVEEIKLYNQPKVAEGKQNRDLYDRLREDIEKSRATYEKRYSDSEVAAAGYFNQELIRILADSDVSLMGLSFPH